MKPVEQVVEQLRRANPVPDPAALLTQLTEAAATQQGESPMNSTTVEAKKPTPTRRPWTPGLTVAVVVLILGVTAVFLTTSRDSRADGLSPVEVAEAYIDARNDYDVERARELLSDVVTSSEFPGSTPFPGNISVETLDLVFRIWDDFEFEFTEVSCEEVVERSNGVFVRCGHLWNTALHRVGNLPPTPAALTMFIQDGRVLSVAETNADRRWWDLFVDFLESDAAADVVGEIHKALHFLDPAAIQTVSEELPAYLDLYAEWLDTRGS